MAHPVTSHKAVQYSKVLRSIKKLLILVLAVSFPVSDICEVEMGFEEFTFLLGLMRNPPRICVRFTAYEQSAEALQLPIIICPLVRSQIQLAAIGCRCVKLIRQPAFDAADNRLESAGTSNRWSYSRLSLCDS